MDHGTDCTNNQTFRKFEYKCHGENKICMVSPDPPLCYNCNTGTTCTVTTVTPWTTAQTAPTIKHSASSSTSVTGRTRSVW
ncbi:hypothetical protein M8J75_011914 [Diaphorina citri]|nr:hypothetical protein M8J75_011914 [Diaphorina citri]